MREHLVIGTEIARNTAGFALRRSMIAHQFQLKLSGLLIAVLVSAALAFPDSILEDTAPPPQSQLKTFPLHNSPHSADISPDEKLVVTESTFQSEVGDAAMRQFAEVVQLWNFEEDKLVAEFRLPKVEVRPYAKDYSIDPIRAGRAVRFTPDGSRVAALVDRMIHVLHTPDMKELHSFQLSAPNEFSVRAMEVSPAGDLAAVLVTERLHGRVDIYDLASGATVQSWDTPLGWIEFTRGLAWHPNGKLLFLAIPNATPCMAPTNQPDVFAFDVMTGTIKQKFTTGLLTGSIAVSADGRVLAVDENCLGVFANHDPKLRVFELSTGKRIRKVSGRGAGVRYSVFISANGSRILAFTGKVKMKFDWSDAVPQDVRVDATFSVWNLSNYEGVVTSQNLPGLNPKALRLSPKGGYAVSVGKASFVYELPRR